MMRYRVFRFFYSPRSMRRVGTVAAVASSVVLAQVYNLWSINECTCQTDMSGRIIVITGGTSGIGKATAMMLARRNATVIIAGKDLQRGSDAAAEIRHSTSNEHVTFYPLDLRSFDSVRKFSGEIRQTEGRVDVLINNAGVAGAGGARLLTEDGCEMVMQTNYLGHFLLTLALKDLMMKSSHSKIINVVSSNYTRGKLDLNDLASWKNYSDGRAYRNSKLAVALFTSELARRLQGSGICVNAVNPGLSQTRIVNTMPPFQSFITRTLLTFFRRTPYDGAQTLLHVALSPELDRASGNYFKNCKARKLAKVAQDTELAGKLFSLSEDIVQHKM